MSEATSSPTPNNVPTQGPELDTPQVLEVLEQPCAKVLIEGPAADLARAMHAAGADLDAALEQQAIPRISFFTHPLPSRGDAEVAQELGALTHKPVAASGRVVPGSWPAGTYARVVYSGHFDGLPAAWTEFSNWIEAHHLHPLPNARYERYLTGPLSTPDSTQWRTELNVQLDAPNVNG